MNLEKFTEGNEFLDEYIKDKKYIYLTSITHEFSEMAYNWFLSLKNIKQDHLALVIALDEKCYKEMLNYNIPCVFIDCNIKRNDTFNEWVENEKSFKIIGVYYILKKYKISFIFSDVDIVFLKNPIEKLEEEILNYDFVVMSDRRYDKFESKFEKNLNSPQALFGIQNAGFSYFKYLQDREDILEKFLKCYEVFYENSPYFDNFPKGIEAGCVQTLSIKRYNELNLKIKILKTYEFVNGSLWQIPYLKKKVENSCYLVHYNFANEDTPKNINLNKTKWMKENNHWYV